VYPSSHKVPALTSPSLPSPLIDSTTITAHLIDAYPSLRPDAHAREIDALLEELHEISYVTLTFKPHERRMEAVVDTIKDMIAQDGIGERHKQLLAGKMAK
jgi:glutathione S-transferase